MKGRVLIVAGSDSGGGAGIQADIKAVTALQGYAATAITALTAQNTLGVHGIHEVPVEFIVQQMQVVLEDIGADCVKTGMLASVPVIEAVAETIARLAPDAPLVVDPVMVAKGGASLLATDAVESLRGHLVARATVVTPNAPEAEKLVGMPVRNRAEMRDAAQAILALGPRAVLLKGGHVEGDNVFDLLALADGSELLYTAPRIDTAHTHGTGCTLASAIAAGLAAGMAIEEAVTRARHYVRNAIEQAPGFGKGHGPLDHGHTVRPFETERA